MLVVLRNARSGPKAVVSRSVRIDTPVATRNLESENVSRLNAARRSSLVSIGRPGVELVLLEPRDPRGHVGRAKTGVLVHLLRAQDPSALSVCHTGPRHPVPGRLTPPRSE